MKVIYAQLGYEKNILQALDNAIKVRPFVDECIVITDSPTTLAMEQYAAFIYYKWKDDYAVYANHMVEEARKLKADYLLISDPDEQFDILFLQNLRDIIQKAPEINGFEIYCHLNIDGFEKLDAGTQAREAPGGIGEDTNSWKLLMFKIEERTKIARIGNSETTTHPTIIGDWNILKLPKKYFYNHNKSYIDVWSSSVRNIYLAGGGDNEGNNNQYYVDLKTILKKLNINTYNEFINYCRKGNINEELKKLIVDNRNSNDKYYSSELRDMFHWYFDYLHKEENLNYISSYTPTVNEVADALVQRAYFTVLGRHTDEDGRHHYSQRIASGEINYGQLEYALHHSDQYLKNLSNTLAFEFLNRVATEDELKRIKEILK